ncbi:1,4-dihydroxy-2-naphthoate octaprenyltransferase [Pricia sp. S334]|uniref:1,4-dihydroxy-2-naphthoate octaprenyltransferase n=1 Tax=Pricia mediterranea TaxID=3076079 RepID=A0ABU3L9S1_9FLAO|nr:1,4-dihydroxy-2-naphthoate octaprenyltransferase [Pricia sp. S334]MDT7830143.1 1,4-dihydroxy-2-naphthoate octaprenyltransferase [Pricia sp. S334]
MELPRKIKPWLHAARLRTLPLSISGVLVGTGLANYYGEADTLIFILSICTTIGLQVTSNFANDYGDGVRGTDNEDRIGPKRALQSGLLTPKKLKKGILVSVVIDVLLVVSLIYVAFGPQNLLFSAVFLILGAAGIWASLKYTIGRSAYGYRGLGDLFVLLFFGWVAVLGSMFLYTEALTPLATLPATAIGLLSVGVLNLNNLRDVFSDKKAGKNTLAVYMGFENAKIYHYLLLISAFTCTILFLNIQFGKWPLSYLPLLAFIPIFFHLIRIYRTTLPQSIDSELKKLALSTFFLAVLMYIICNIFS